MSTSVAGGPELDEAKEKKAEEEESLDASTTYEVVRREGLSELDRSPRALAWSGLAAGLSMGFSLVAEGLLRSHLPDAPWRPLVAKLGYTTGFLIVVLGSQQLFTENTLTPIVPLLADRSRRLLGVVARLWLVVLVANLVGAALFALVIGRTTTFDPEAHRAFLAIALESLRGSFGETALRGVFAGWLIALMVWMLPAAQTAQPVVIVAMTYLVGLAGLAHIIAGTVDVMYLVVRGVVTLGEAVGRFMVPALLGNIAGGLVLVAALNHAQVVSGEQAHGRPAARG